MGSIPASGRWVTARAFGIAIMILACSAPTQARAQSLQTKYEERLKEINLITSMESSLYAASEAEKLAVMADSDDASKEFADKARALSASLEQARNELAALAAGAKLDKETALLGEFDVCWQEYRKVDAQILELAVQNTNLKAARLSQGQALALLDRFKQFLGRIDLEGGDQKFEERLKILKDQAVMAVQRIQILHAPHIDEADAGKMEAMEREMKLQEETARKALDDMEAQAGEKGAALVRESKNLLGEYMKMTWEIVALSRQNTNVDSLRLSLSRKRALTATCSETLAALKKVAFDRGFKATR